jgi:uncharacterized LabA/DUF88 family protein
VTDETNRYDYRAVNADTRLRIAVFIDFDNIEIGVKNTLNTQFDVGLVLEALKERGEVVSKIAYSDWQRSGGYSRQLSQHAIKMVQRNLTPGGDKNGADINLALDALEMAFTLSHINAFVIVGGDSDFISLVEKLKQYDKKVFVVGGRQFTSVIMQRNCHEFMAYEDLVGSGSRRHAERGAPAERTPIEQAIPLVTRALKVIEEREVSPQMGLLKSTLTQLDSTFSERRYGAGSFRDFVERLAHAGIVTVQHSRGGLLVELAEHGAAPAAGAAPADAPAEGEERRETSEAQPRHHAPAPPPQALGSTTDGVRRFQEILAFANVTRWPMYLRNVKQVLRQCVPPFDERAYGFGSLVDLLRAAQKDGFVRVDRDRQGVMRVFPGQAFASVASQASASAPEAAAVEPSSPEAAEVTSSVVSSEESLGNRADVEVAPVVEVADAEDELQPPDLVDTVAEALKAGATPGQKRARGRRAPRDGGPSATNRAARARRSPRR